MRLTGRDVMEAVTEVVLASAPGEELDWGRVADRLNVRLETRLAGRSPEFAGKHQRQAVAR